MIQASEYAKRRDKLLAKMPDGSALLVFAGKAKSSSADETYPFEVNRNFYYLSGIEQEGSSLLLIKSDGEKKEYLFIDPFNPVKEKWYGKKLTPEEARDLSGVNNVLLSGALTSKLDSLLNPEILEFGHISALFLDLEKELKIEEETFTTDYAESLKMIYPNIIVEDCYKMITRLRMVKSPAEVEEYRRAVQITALGVRAVMVAQRAGMKEYELANLFLHTINDESAFQGLAFPTIMASGIHTTVLHYPTPLDTLKTGDMLQLDLGARNSYYCADVSRAFPVDRVFTDIQKTVYEIVLGCNKAVASFARPGVTIQELQSFTIEYLSSECLAKHLIEKKEDIKNYYFHSVSHHIGLDTHDPADRTLPLEEGNIISDEPGLYFPELGFGVRIEDDLLITKNGAENLTQDIIKEVRDIEKFYRG
ncbi:MAG: aminopeptidase P family protein [Bacilli bacterium]|nr:aminopeptidase P family protein [Bacilli bacterium]